MTEELFLDWIGKVWGPYAKNFSRSLLILDQFSVHRSDKVKKELSKLNTDVLFIPAGMTARLQPLDIYVNKPLKAIMQKQWEIYLSSDFVKKNKNG